MFNSLTYFEENKLSETAVEFRILNETPVRPAHVVLIFFFIVITTVALLYGFIILKALSISTGCVLFFLLKYAVKEESIIIIRDFGVQLRIIYLFGSEKTKFLDADRIEGVFIHEYIYGSQCSYCLAFFVKGQETLSLLFKHLYPGFDELRTVYASSLLMKGG